MSRLAAVLFTLLVACTGGPSGQPPQPSPTGSPAAPAEVVELAVVAGRGTDAYLEGMEVAVRQVNGSGGIDGVPVRLHLEVDLDASGRWPVTFVVGRADGVTRLRPEIESSRAVMVVVGDDLYSSRELFRPVFQFSVPELWQARKLARLLVADLRLDRLVLVSDDRDTVAAYTAGFAEEGASLAVIEPGASVPTARRVADADAVLVPGPAGEAARLAGAIVDLPQPPPLALGAHGLSLDVALPPGTVAPYHYAWSGWAEPITRVARFRERFAHVHTGPPEALQQEGYDAVRLVADALSRTGGRGGEPLIRALEAVRDATYSSLPLRLGPDDHVLLPQGQLGVYAVARPGTDAPAEALAPNPWRPVMRTFTYNGERVTIVRRDLRVFFPRWRHPAPTPEFQRSRLGITSPAGTPPR